MVEQNYTDNLKEQLSAKTFERTSNNGIMNHLSPFNYELICYSAFYYLLLFCNNFLQIALQICEMKITRFLRHNWVAELETTGRDKC
jgi:hypothetical protein